MVFYGRQSRSTNIYMVLIDKILLRAINKYYIELAMYKNSSKSLKVFFLLFFFDMHVQQLIFEA